MIGRWAGPCALTGRSVPGYCQSRQRSTRAGPFPGAAPKQLALLPRRHRFSSGYRAGESPLGASLSRSLLSLSWTSRVGSRRRDAAEAAEKVTDGAEPDHRDFFFFFTSHRFRIFQAAALPPRGLVFFQPALTHHRSDNISKHPRGAFLLRWSIASRRTTLSPCVTALAVGILRSSSSIHAFEWHFFGIWRYL